MPFFGIGMKTDLFQSCGHCWVFQICWHIECSTFTESSFRIWNSSTGIPSPPLALFIVMLPKAHLTSHSRMSSSRWVITPLWLSAWLVHSKSSLAWQLVGSSINVCWMNKLGFPCGPAGKESAAMRETWVRSLCWKDPLEKGMDTHSSVLA